MNTQIPEIPIRVTKEVTFRDSEGTILAAYNPGDVLKATADVGHYFVTSMGGIYKDEAERILS